MGMDHAAQLDFLNHDLPTWIMDQIIVGILQNITVECFIWKFQNEKNQVWSAIILREISNQILNFIHLLLL